MTKAVERILEAYERGYPAILVTGRSLYDLVVDEEGKLRPLIEVLRRACRSRYGMVFITYSMAGGLDWDSSRIRDERDRRLIGQALQAHHLLDIPPDQNEVVRVIRGIASLSRTPTEGLRWSDGSPMKFAFLFEFTEHLTPGSLTNGTQTDPQLVAIELAHITAQSLALRSSGNFIIFHGREGLIDELVSRALYHVRLPQPDREEKRTFLRAALSLYTAASFENGLTLDAVAHLTTNTPNRGLEELLRASHRSRRPITARQLVEQKSRDVEELSEHTLRVLDRAHSPLLFGRNIVTPMKILEGYAQALLRGDPWMPANILLVGPPGNGKTDLAVLTARKGKAAAYEMLSPKGSLVGETERKARLQQMVLREWAPNVAFCDEITEAFPLERSEFDGDSGASRAVLAALLTALSDESRRGRSLLIATTNCPWRMAAAIRSRFIVIPVLHPLKEDFPGILLAIARQISPTVDLSLEDPRIQEAARIFYEKGGTPRDIRQALCHMRTKGELTPEGILAAAWDFCGSVDLPSIIYADLWAIRSCSFRSYLPWNENPSEYPFPPHLDGVVDRATGEIHYQELRKRIEEYRPYANV